MSLMNSEGFSSEPVLELPFSEFSNNVKMHFWQKIALFFQEILG